MENIGLIGLGAVGSGLALNLAEQGYDLYVADALPKSNFEGLLKQGAGRLHWTTADELCATCHVVLTSLPSVKIIDLVAEKHIFPRLKGA